MNTTTKALALALAGLATVTPAKAETFKGLYIQGGIGGSWLSDSSNDGELLVLPPF